MRARAVGRVRCSVPNRHVECEVDVVVGGEGNTTSKTAWRGEAADKSRVQTTGKERVPFKYLWAMQRDSEQALKGCGSRAGWTFIRTASWIVEITACQRNGPCRLADGVTQDGQAKAVHGEGVLRDASG